MRMVKKLAPDLKLICDTDSVWSRFILRELPLVTDIKSRKNIKRTGLLKQVEEQNWVKFCDVTTAVSLVDAQYYQQFDKSKSKIKIFANVIDLKTIL